MKNIKESRQLGNVQALRKIFKGGGEVALIIFAIS